MADFKTVRVLAAGDNIPNVRKVNILDALTAGIATCLQTDVDTRTCETVQALADATPGLPTIAIDGYEPEE